MSDDDQEVRGDREPPRVVVTRLTDDQTAMLALFDQPGEQRHPSPLYIEDAPTGLTKLDPAISVHVVRQYMCPVVTFRGRPFMILPNGDVCEIRERR